MENIDPEDLLKRYHNGECTPEEEVLVECFYLDDELSADELSEESPRLKYNKPIKRIVAIVSIIIAVLGVFAFFIIPMVGGGLPAAYANDIDPGFNRAVLTLSDGRKIDLTDAETGALADESGIEVIKAADGQLIYRVLQDTRSAGDQYNTITTPKGGQYQIVLPDGTKIWLNAASSLSYRTSLTDVDGVRRVKMSGEAYFDISKDPERPFVVTTDQQELRVLGTRFNLMAYTDEPTTKTTLLEGSVRVTMKELSARKEVVVLKPNQQSTVSDGHHIRVQQVDPEQAAAWKNGEFMFRYETLESIMRKVARWYDVEIVYEDKLVGEQLFGGAISRFEKVSQLLGLLELTGDVHFKIEGRKITVM